VGILDRVVERAQVVPEGRRLAVEQAAARPGGHVLGQLVAEVEHERGRGLDLHLLLAEQEPERDQPCAGQPEDDDERDDPTPMPGHGSSLDDLERARQGAGQTGSI
jgi:hypothetical protein